jgi:hypothetical protein
MNCSDCRYWSQFGEQRDGKRLCVHASKHGCATWGTDAACAKFAEAFLGPIDAHPFSPAQYRIEDLVKEGAHHE